MSRVYGPALVGNDMVVSRGTPTYRKRAYIDRINTPPEAKTDEPKEERKSLPYLFQYMLEATPAVPVVVPDVSDSLMAYNNGAIGTSTRRRLRFSRAALVTLLTLMVVGGFTGAGLAYKKQLVKAVDNIKTALATHNASTKASPTQIVIHSADYNNAITALMTQQISINVAGSIQTVSPNTIISWLSVRKTGSSTYISVKTNQVIQYVNQLASSVGGIQESKIRSSASQISDNLLSANGITINL